MQLDRLLEERNEPETDQLRWWAKSAVAAAVLVTVLLSLLSWRTAQQAKETADWVIHTNEVMTVLESTLRHSVDVETGGRGFAETGSVPFLEPFQSGRPAVVQDLHALRLLLVTLDQQQRLSVLEKQANSQVEDVDEIVATRQNTGKIPSLDCLHEGNTTWMRSAPRSDRWKWRKGGCLSRAASVPAPHNIPLLLSSRRAHCWV
jgi:hypothetical protein